jgi:large subunit ribosomal protein L19
MTNKILEIEKQEIKGKNIPKIKSGDIVRVVQAYQEKEKERHSVFEGMVIAINSGSGTRRTITVRRVIDGVGVEKIIPLYLSNIIQIKVLKSSKTRRAKLYYLRKLSGKKARLKEKGLDKDVIEMMATKEKATKELKNEKTEQQKVEKKEEPKAQKEGENKPKKSKKEEKNDTKEQKAGK